VHSIGFSYYLGCHHASWLYRDHRRALMISRRTLVSAVRLKPAVVPYAIDSAGFTEVDEFGGYSFCAMTFAREVAAWEDQLGPADFVGTQDWPCRRSTLQRTGLCVREHQQRTAASFFELAALAGETRWIPILQGLSGEDYLAHAELYEKAGVRLSSLPLVGVGGIANRQDEPGIVNAVRQLAESGIRLHGFGIKGRGLPYLLPYLASADSMSWSREARYEARRHDHTQPDACSHMASCANCFHRALEWLEELLNTASETPPPPPAANQPLLLSAAPAVTSIAEIFETLREDEDPRTEPPLGAQADTCLTRLLIAMSMADAQTSVTSLHTGEPARSEPDSKRIGMNLGYITEVVARHARTASYTPYRSAW
jgi:hypothetical protein